MAISITLTHSIKQTDKGTVKLELQTTATDTTEKVFAIEVLPRCADSLAPLFRFSHICSPSELVEFPDTVPGCACYFRTDEITMIFDTPVNAELVLQNIEKDIAKLVSELKILEDQPVESDTITFA